MYEKWATHCITSMTSMYYYVVCISSIPSSLLKVISKSAVYNPSFLPYESTPWVGWTLSWWRRVIMGWKNFPWMKLNYSLQLYVLIAVLHKCFVTISKLLLAMHSLSQLKMYFCKDIGRIRSSNKIEQFAFTCDQCRLLTTWIVSSAMKVILLAIWTG